MATSELTIDIGSQLDFESIPFTPIWHRRHIALMRLTGTVAHRSPNSEWAGNSDAPQLDIALQWPRVDELEQVADLCRRKEVWPAFGFKHPPRREHIMGGRLPDGFGTFESVEFLLIREDRRSPQEASQEKRLIGLFVVYDYPWRGGKTIEIDLVITEAFAAHLNLMSLRTIILSYLFAIRGCARVLWKRSKAIRFYEESLDRLKRQLHRLEQKKASLPRVVLQSTPWTQAVFGSLSSNP